MISNLPKSQFCHKVLYSLEYTSFCLGLSWGKFFRYTVRIKGGNSLLLWGCLWGCFSVSIHLYWRFYSKRDTGRTPLISLRHSSRQQSIWPNGFSIGIIQATRRWVWGRPGGIAVMTVTLRRQPLLLAGWTENSCLLQGQPVHQKYSDESEEESNKTPAWRESSSAQ